MSLKPPDRPLYPAVEREPILLPETSLQQVSEAPGDPRLVHVVGGITGVQVHSDGRVSGSDIVGGYLEVRNQLDPHG